MNKSLFKFVTDIGPLVIFFYFYYNSDKDLKVAIPPLIVATIASVLFCLGLGKKDTDGPIVKWNFGYFVWWFNYIF